MRLTIVLTAACLFLSACGHGGDAGDSPSNDALTTPQDIPTMAYYSYREMIDQDHGIWKDYYVLFTPGYVETRIYFSYGALGLNNFQKIVAKDQRDGEAHTFTTTYSSCPSINGEPVPSSGTFEASMISADGREISIDPPGADSTITMTVPPTGLNGQVAPFGDPTVSENTNCTPCAAGLIKIMDMCLPQGACAAGSAQIGQRCYQTF